MNSALKNLLIGYWYKNVAKVSQLYRVTTENGSSNKLSYEEFKNMTGITVQVYEANISTFENMKYQDLVNGGYI